MNVNEFMSMYYGAKRFDECNLIVQYNRPMAVCRDGFKISIQGSENHYCSPRENGNIEYKEVELGFPSEPDELIKDYAEDDDYTQTVYGYVPVEIVDRLLEKHGGIVGAKTDHMKEWRTGNEVCGITYFVEPELVELINKYVIKDIIKTIKAYEKYKKKYKK